MSKPFVAIVMLSVADEQLAQALSDERAANAQGIYAKDTALQESLKG